MFVALSIIALGLLICLVGGIWFIVVAFQRHILWGIAVLVVPLANLVFLLVAWAEAKKPFLINLAGTLLLLVGIFTLPEESRASLVRLGATSGVAEIDMNALQTASAPPAAPTREEIQQRLAALRTREADLLARKAAVDTSDAAAVSQLDAEIRQYNEELQPLLEQLK
jgi:hypothetical protein